jgi:DNA-directed RNA polymerase subunit RPC12/RpoP
MPLSASAIGVICKRCRKPIKLDHTDRVAEEFSVACPHCGHRAFYQDREIKPLGEK